MAEALLRRRRPEFDVHSAGLEAQGVNPYTLDVLGELGIDTSPLVSETVFDYIGKAFRPTYLVTVCARAEKNCPMIWPGQTIRLHWPFDDPAAASGSPEHVRAEFRRIRDEIDARINAFLAAESV